jgi:hypothetical protein
MSSLRLRDRPPQPTKARGMVHFLIADTAKAMCEAWYSNTASHDNLFYSIHKDPKAFVSTHWPNFIKHAREHLAELLNPGMGITESQRQEIYTALKLNAGVNPHANMVERIIQGTE